MLFCRQRYSSLHGWGRHITNFSRLSAYAVAILVFSSYFIPLQITKVSHISIQNTILSRFIHVNQQIWYENTSHISFGEFALAHTRGHDDRANWELISIDCGNQGKKPTSPGALNHFSWMFPFERSTLKCFINITRIPITTSHIHSIWMESNAYSASQ